MKYIYPVSGGCHPIYDGYVVCEEFVDIIMDAWNQEQANKVRGLLLVVFFGWIFPFSTYTQIRKKKYAFRTDCTCVSLSRSFNKYLFFKIWFGIILLLWCLSYV